MRYATIKAFVAVFVLTIVCCSPSSSDKRSSDRLLEKDAEGPAEKDDESARDGLWGEPDDLILEERIRWRPGNFEALSAIDRFLQGQYSLRPKLQAVAFPCYIQSRKFESLEQYEESIKAKEAKILEGERMLRNKFRSYVLQLHSIEMRNFEAGEGFNDTLDDLRAPAGVKERLQELRVVHTGKAVVLRLEAVSKTA